MRHVGHLAIRSRGTVCGSLAHADPPAEWPALAVALGAELVVEGPAGGRVVPAAAFATGYLQTVLDDDELLVGMRLPAPPRSGAAVGEVARRHGDFAMVGVVAELALTEDGERLGGALFGVAGTPWRPDGLGELVPSSASDDPARVSEERGTLVADTLQPPADNHAGAAYRHHVAQELTRRTLAAALAEARAAAPVAASR